MVYFYFLKKCIEGYINELECRLTTGESLTPEQVQDAIITLPDDLSGKFIDIDARDKFYLYAVSTIMKYIDVENLVWI